MSSFPKRLVVESNNYCNLKCSSCITGRRKRSERGVMAPGTFAKILKEVKEKKECVFMSFQGGGEPLMSRQFLEYVKETKKQAPWVETHISTNATLLTTEMGKDIVDSGLDRIYFSIDSMNKDTYEKLRLGAKFESVMENIEQILSMIQARGVSLVTGVTFIRQLANEDEIEDFETYWQGKVDVVNMITYQTYTGEIEDQRTRKDIERTPKKRYPCRQLLRGDIAIHWDGSVFGCCRSMRSDLNLGNVLNSSITEIYNGGKRKSLIELHKEKKWDDIESCRDCVQEWSF